MMYSNLITAQQCSGILDQNLIIIDCRFQLADTEAGRITYQTSHLPGAYYAHLDEDCSGLVTSSTGRHPLPEMSTFLQKIASWGIQKDSQVIVYDDKTGAIAARLWWMLKGIDVQHVAILDGGFSYWQISGFPLVSQQPSFLNRDTDIRAVKWVYVTTAQMQQLISDPQYLIIDARAADRYAGLTEPIDAIAGHIPGAINRFHGENFTADGLFKTADQLKLEFSKLISDYALDHVIVYCGSGVTSCANLAAMEIAGLPGAKLYAGSWSEWIQNSENPIVTEKIN